MTLQLRKANKAKVKFRVGLQGSSGSGKTMSALLLARGVTDWDKIAVIDTENGSAELYQGFVDHERGIEIGTFNVVSLSPPFSPEHYIEAIKLCESEGVEVIIVDSVSHEWEGSGGILEIVDKLTKASSSKNSYFVWGKVTPRHNAFVQAILHAKAHVIATVRAKQDYVISNKNGKNVPEKVGLKGVTREGFDYEFMTFFDLTINNLAEATKDRTGIFKNKPEFIITPETGTTLKEWAAKGVDRELIDSQKNLLIARIKESIKSMKEGEQIKRTLCEVVFGTTDFKQVTVMELPELEEKEKELGQLIKQLHKEGDDEQSKLHYLNDYRSVHLPLKKAKKKEEAA